MICEQDKLVTLQQNNINPEQDNIIKKQQHKNNAEQINQNQYENIKQPQTFNLQTSSYKLNVTFNQQKLTLQLKDKVNWIDYYRQYTEQDIGKQINRKAELKDIFQSFQMVKNGDNCQESQDMDVESKSSVKQCKFGSVILHDKKPSFKIYSGGIVTVYVCLCKISTKQIITHQSILHLQTKYQLNQKQIINQINNQKSQLKVQNKKLKKQITKYKKEAEKLRYFGRIRMNPNLLNFSITYNQNSRIQYTGKNKQWTQFILPEVIPYNKIYSFKIKIVRTTSKSIMIGVIDYKKHKLQKSSYNSGYAVCYLGTDGSKYGSNPLKKEGIGFNEGQTVQTIVDLAAKSIQWVVKGETRANLVYESLGDQSITYSPYFEMYNPNDVVELVV